MVALHLKRSTVHKVLTQFNMILMWTCKLQLFHCLNIYWFDLDQGITVWTVMNFVAVDKSENWLKRLKDT